MKVLVKDGKGERIVTEIRRPDPQAVLVLKENVEYELSEIELYRLVTLNYVSIKDIVVDGKTVLSVYPDSITFGAEVKQEPVKVEPPKPVQPQVKAPVPAAQQIKKG